MNTEKWNDYLPFRGLTAWFSSSVRPCGSRKWDQNGGSFAGEEDADFLFSDNTFSVDTVRVYDTQPSVTVFQSAWVNDVIVKRCTIHDLPLGHYLVLPHYLVQVCVSGDPFKTPKAATLMEQYRQTESQAALANTSLSQLLTRREERRTRSRRKEDEKGGGGRLKNSREFFSPSNKHSAREVSYEDGKIGQSEGSSLTGVSGAATAEGISQCSSGLSDAVWGKLVQCMKTASLTEMRYISDVEVTDHELVDFNPQLPEFAMKRK